MLILGLNTATSITQIALVQENKIIAENSWKSEQNESEKLLPELTKLLRKADKKWKDINKIAVIQGPGPFTALRVSIAVANALAYALNIPIIGVPTVDYWKYRFDGDFMLNAGLNRVYFKEELIVFDEVVKKLEPSAKISGHLKENQIEKLTEKGIKWIPEEDLLSLGKFISNMKKYEEKSLIKPLYFAPPHITKSEKLYK